MTPYTALPNNFTLDDIDQADEGHFNDVIWNSVKGHDSPYSMIAKRSEVDVEAGPGVEESED